MIIQCQFRMNISWDKQDFWSKVWQQKLCDLRISRGRFFAPYFGGQKLDLYAEKYGSHTGQTGCVIGFSPSHHSHTWTVCKSAGQNGACFIKMAREEIGLQPRSKVILRHAQQDFDTTSSKVFLLPIFRVPGKISVIRVLGEKHIIKLLMS